MLNVNIPCAKNQPPSSPAAVSPASLARPQSPRHTSASAAASLNSAIHHRLQEKIMRIIEVLQNGLPGCVKIIAESGVERIRRKPRNHGDCAIISSVIRQTPILSEPNASCARPFSNSCSSPECAALRHGEKGDEYQRHKQPRAHERQQSLSRQGARRMAHQQR